jgi:acetoacetate decarboxylase
MSEEGQVMGILDEMRGIKGDAEWMWANASILAIDMTVDAKAAASWLPGGMKLLEPTRATVFVADYPELTIDVDPYHEVAILLHVRFGWMRAVFNPWILVDDDSALILGREALGCPKKMGKISLTVDGNSVKASVERKGTNLLEVSGTLKGPDPDPPPFFDRYWINVWGLMGLSVQKLLRWRADEEIQEAQKADVNLSVNGSAKDPLHELKLGEVLEARLYRMNFARTRSKAVPIPIFPVSPRFMLRNYALRHL